MRALGLISGGSPKRTYRRRREPKDRIFRYSRAGTSVAV